MENDVKEILTMDMALDTVEESFRLMAEGTASNSPRSRIRLPNGVLNFMAGAAPGIGVMGFKSYGVTRGNPVKFYVQLSSTETGELLAVIEASDLGQIRTGAASGVATKYMAKEDASSVGVIGSGYQARTQLEAVCKIRPITSARVYSRKPENREKFAADMSASLGIEVTASESGEACVKDVDVVITMTSTSRPVLEGDWLSPGTHINAAGANHWMRRELDGKAVGRADVVVTDDIEQAKLECGDLIYPNEFGTIRWEQVISLSDVVAGVAKGRNSAEDITLFESQGLALQDLTTGMRIYNIAKERGLGQQLPF
jgi:ornithine cyclodeaminase/alanine dehydrogenase-like protein (mu-crystallin family)